MAKVKGFADVSIIEVPKSVDFQLIKREIILSGSELITGTLGIWV